MLTRPQIQRLAQRNSIGMQAQERDYIQHILLFALYSQSQALIFKGGTALRIVYQGNRYSEDLDFNGPDDVPALQDLWEQVAKRLLSFGVVNEIRNQWESDVGYSFDISYQGPLHDGRDRSKGKVRVDINLRQEDIESQRAFVSPAYDDLRPFVATTISQKYMLAEKMRALLIRGKPRDLYDIWFLTQQGVSLDLDVLKRKLAGHNVRVSLSRFEESLEGVRPEWKRDLRPLLSQYVSWEDISAGLDHLRNQLKAP
jgi:predicted nucleotidyltransferase component of viral defense system